jgi:flagellar FliL protein
MSMPDEKAEVEAEAEAAPKSSKMGLIIVLNMVMMAGVVVYFLFFNQQQPPPANAAGLEAQPVAVTTPKEPGPLLSLENFIVNLADRDANRYLKVGLALELSSEEVQETISKREPIIRDAFISMASSMTYKLIRTHQGKQTLRDNLKNKMDTLLGKGVVQGVYFTEFVIQ